ncbi:glycerophosphodiester phosphodiesterase [Candidatus Thorarchaeota archaeon]|nr:MAG: glycerophosphodiester phosphodiesterase [Candidatus Thorarchaeota archaeon]
MKERLIFNIGRPLVMAHRGESGNIPENTMAALEAAVELGVDVVETDARLTKDDHIVLFHDDDLVRTTGEEGTVRDYSLEELLEFDIGHNFTSDNGATFPFRGRGHRIVTLREVFERFPDTIFNLDIKDTLPEAPKEMAHLISDMNREQSVLVASFTDIQLERFRKFLPDVPTSAHPGEVKRFVLSSKIGVPRIKKEDVHYKAFQVPIKSGPLTIVTQKFIKMAHGREVAVHVWTINNEPTMNTLLDLGVDGIFTDHPALLKSVLQKRGLL